MSFYTSKKIGSILAITLILQLMTQPACSSAEKSFDRNQDRPFLLAQTPTETKQKKAFVIDVLEAHDKDIVDVLKIIALKGNLNIITDEGVAGKVTIFLKEIDARDALKIILDTKNLAFVEEQGLIRVMSAERFEERYGYAFGQKMGTRILPVLYAEASQITGFLDQMKSPRGKVIYNEETKILVLIDTTLKLDAMEALVQKIDVPLETRHFDLSLIKAKEIAPQIKIVLTPGRGALEINEDLNFIRVTDTPLKLKEIDRLLESLDKEQKTLVVEAQVYQVVLHEEYHEGIDWEAIVSDYQAMPFMGFNPQAVDDRKSLPLSFGTISAEDLPVLCDALDAVGVVHQIKTTLLEADQEKIFELDVRSKDFPSIDGEEDSTFFEKSESVRLALRPGVKADNVLSLEIAPEFATLDRQAKIAARLQKKTVVLDVAEGDTLVVGGLRKDVTIESQRRVPFLGVLPFVGGAFRRQGTRSLLTEIVVFMTPRFVENSILTDERDGY